MVPVSSPSVETCRYLYAVAPPWIFCEVYNWKRDGRPHLHCALSELFICRAYAGADQSNFTTTGCARPVVSALKGSRTFCRDTGLPPRGDILPFPSLSTTLMVICGLWWVKRAANIKHSLETRNINLSSKPRLRPSGDIMHLGIRLRQVELCAASLDCSSWLFIDLRLASAIALKRAGHNVLVLEKDLQLGGIGSVPNGSGCAQICPNGCKILLDWGLEAEIDAKSAPCWGFSLYKYMAREAIDPDHLGINRYDAAVLDEARGRYVQFVHRDLLRCTSICWEVANVDCDACSVTLRSGETHTAHAIIGADGARGVVRTTLIEEEEGTAQQSDDGLGVALYHATVPKALLDEHDLSVFYHHLGMTVWTGPNRGRHLVYSVLKADIHSNDAGLRAFVVGNEQDISLFLFTPDICQASTWTQEAKTKITDVLGPCDEQIRKLAELAGPRSACDMIQPRTNSNPGCRKAEGFSSWVMPPIRSRPGRKHGATQAYSVALEDAAFVGKIFSHTKNPVRVPEFFRAFQEHREPRVSYILGVQDHYSFLLLMPDGETQVHRDAALRARHAVGQNVFDDDLEDMMEADRIMFSYDSADDADEWWINWGRYRAVSELSPPQEAFRLTISKSMTQGDEEQD
ncbi:hypothetical protein C8R45DRAFT_1215119 [Mycena sanguinolenta]|nr:hypothetical protein C8R45DRAFT_1215119 [Mycena sanguinolenta]